MRIDRKLLIGGILLLGCVVASSAFADSVYMKTGRVIYTSSARIEGDRVFVRIYGGEVAFPLSMIDRVVEDDNVEQPASEVPVTEPAAGDPDAAAPEGAADAEGQQGDPSTDPDAQGDPSADPEQETPPDTPPEQTREYWQGRARPHLDLIARVDRELTRLRALTSPSAAHLAEIRRGEAARDQAQAQLDAIRVEARRLGVPAGWLR